MLAGFALRAAEPALHDSPRLGAGVDHNGQPARKPENAHGREQVGFQDLAGLREFG